MRRTLVPLGVGLILGFASCALFDRATDPDPKVSGPAKAEIIGAGGVIGTAVGGPVGGALGAELAAGAVALWAVYQKATEKKRHQKYSSARQAPSVRTV